MKRFNKPTWLKTPVVFTVTWVKLTNPTPPCKRVDLLYQDRPVYFVASKDMFGIKELMINFPTRRLIVQFKWKW